MTPPSQPVAHGARAAGSSSPTQLRAVFFDAGNTLFFEKPSRFEIYAAAARDLGLGVAGDDVRRAMLAEHDRLPAVDGEAVRYTDRWFRAYVPAVFRSLGAGPDRLEGFADELLQRFRRTARFHLFPETLEVLDALRARGVRTAIVSNWSARLAKHLDDLDLTRRFDAVLISAVEGLEKPDRALFARALERLGVEPGEAIHVGDHPVKDVEGARAAGLRALLVDREASTAGGTDAIPSLRPILTIVGERP